ncbi:cystatin C (amyloid angiopathy and cerebral hemorrhage) [Gouania willdenowi]|uniref:Cystatin-C-like n=1 Tax=Gouania willdenowi TaxID=441366 RepID=A0A8C5NGN1_GOUWI|nr:cystatin-C-like [Gouania willdenowi]
MAKTLFLAVFAAVLAVSLGGMMTGGWRDVHVNDSNARDALKFAVDSRNNLSNDMYRHDVLEVVKIEQQVVSGMKYRITANLTRTACRKSDFNETCSTNQNQDSATSYQCTFTIWSKPWEKFNKVLEEKC